MPNTEETCQRISCNIINNDLDTGSDYDAIENHKNDIHEKKVNYIELCKQNWEDSKNSLIVKIKVCCLA